MDIISHVKYLDLLRKYFQDSSKLRIVLFFMICHTYYAHTRVPRAHTTLNFRTVYRQLPIFKKRRICGYRRLLCNQILHTFVTIWLVLCLFLKKKSPNPSNIRMNIGEIVAGDVFEYSHTHLKAKLACDTFKFSS